MKKKLLFVMDSLGIGGGEKSLVTLLSLIDYDRYDVDLQLFAYGGAFQQFLHPKVNILPELPYNRFLRNNLIASFCSFDFNKLYSRLTYTYSIHTNKLNHTGKAMTFWQKCSRCYSETEKHYDVAIAYSQGLPTFYVVDKVKASKKIGWVNCVWNLSGEALLFNRSYYEKLDSINIVSDEATNHFKRLFPELIDKFILVKDIVYPDFVRKLSILPTQNKLSNSKIKILTVARLIEDTKGYDILLNVCTILKKRNLIFDWYILGEGTYRSEMEKYIIEHNLLNCVHLLGSVPNPYPYYRMCDLYVQTSRREGFGLSIAEARLLNCPVVTTEYVGVWSQMVQGKNGIVVPIDATAVADAIEDLILHPEKREAISAYQRTEKKGNTEEIEKFYKLIE